VLRVRDFGEADRILTILSDTDGKFDAVARGARRPRSRLVGVTQQFSRGNMLLFRGRSLDTLNTFELLSSYANLSLDVEKMAYASYVAELVDLMTGERQLNELLYALVVSTFEALDAGLRIRKSCSGHLRSSSCQYPGFARAFEVCFVWCV